MRETIAFIFCPVLAAKGNLVDALTQFGQASKLSRTQKPEILEDARGDVPGKRLLYRPILPALARRLNPRIRNKTNLSPLHCRQTWQPEKAQAGDMGAKQTSRNR
jgi:hypothetical protein